MAIQPDAELCQQIEELRRIAEEERSRKLGPGFIREMKDFYNMVYAGSSNITPSYRPRFCIPELQNLLLNEATDLTDTDPKIYISSSGKRDEQREKAYQAHWKQGRFTWQLFMASIWSLLVNAAPIQVGFSPWRRGGKGMVWVKARDPETFLPDPAANSEEDWQFMMFDDYMYIDDVKRFWPERGGLLEPVYTPGAPQQENSLGFQMPPGPMSISSNMPAARAYNDSRVKISHLFIFDNTIERVKEIAGHDAADKLNLLVAPSKRYKYPNGRWIVSCLDQGVVLADGGNPNPKLPDDDRGTFPIVIMQSMPSLTGIWGPAPTKLTRPLQDLAERMYSQLFENAIRLNNGVWFIPEDTGIDPDAFGGMPGEVQVIRAGSQIPQQVWPKEMPSHMAQLPALLLQLQKQLQGFTPQRSGQPGQGNVSADLFDASIFQAQYLTRMRGKLMAQTVQRLSQMVFYYMARFLRRSVFADPHGGDVQHHEWTQVDSTEDYEVMLDEASINPVSGAALRTLVMALGKTGQLPLKYIYEALNIPGGAEMAEEKTREMELAALSKLKRPR
jgi:hypothetical protein